MLQLVPSQCSTRAEPPAAPTAQTLFDEMTVTPLRLSPSISGPVTTLQLVPFQCSINCSPKSGLSGPVLNPTAQTSLLAAAATPKNWAPGPFIPPLGKGGVGTTLQLVPSKCSAGVSGGAPPLADRPDVVVGDRRGRHALGTDGLGTTLKLVEVAAGRRGAGPAPTMVHAGILDDSRVMLGSGSAWNAPARHEELTRFQLIKRRSHRPPGSTWDSGSLVHRCVLPVE